jgi:hypothetical protein
MESRLRMGWEIAGKRFRARLVHLYTFSKRPTSVSTSNLGRRWWRRERISQRNHETDPPADIGASVVSLPDIGR